MLAGEAWPGAARVRVRMGVHTGETDAENYRGLDVVRAARIADAAHGGQILVSESTRDLVGDRLPEVGFKVLAELRLPSIDRPERVSQVVAAGLDAEFPPLRATETLEAPAFDGRGEELAAAALAAVDAEERRLSLFRRSWVGALAGALLLAGAATGIALALTAGGRSVVTVAPDSVVAVDMGTGAVVADTPIGGRPVGIAIGDGAVWAANADDGTVTRIDPENGRVVKTIGLGTDVNSVAVGFGAVWVAGGNDETLTRINPERNAVEAPLHFGKTDPLFPKPVFFVAAGRNAVWITHGNSVERIDPATNRVLKTVRLQAGPTSLGVGDGSVWVTTADERLVRIDENSNRVTARLLLPNFGTSPVVSQGALWLIVYTDRPQIWRLNPGDLTQTASVPVVAAFPFSLAARAGKVWMVDHTKSVLWRMTRDGSRAARVTTIGFHPIALAVGRRYVWVGVQQQPLR